MDMASRLSKIIGSFIGGELITFIGAALIGMFAGIIMDGICLIFMHQSLLGLLWWAGILTTGTGAKVTFIFGILVSIYDYFKHQNGGKH